LEVFKPLKAVLSKLGNVRDHHCFMIKEFKEFEKVW